MCHDLLEPVVQLVGMSSVLELTAGSYAHFATVCASFCWINVLAGITVALVLVAWAGGAALDLLLLSSCWFVGSARRNSKISGHAASGNIVSAWGCLVRQPRNRCTFTAQI